MTADIDWTPKLRRQFFASRATPNPLHLRGGQRSGPMWVPEEVPWPYDLDAAWAYALDQKWPYAPWAQPPVSIRTGFRNATPAMAALGRRARDAFGVRLETLYVEVEAAMAVLDLRPAFKGIPLWVAQEGVVFALRVLLAMMPLCTNESGGGGKNPEQGLFLVEDSRHAGRELAQNNTAWRMMRGLIAIANDADYAAAREVADAARRDAGLYQAAIAFAFPDEPWGDDAADAVLASSDPARAEAVQMVLTVASVERGTEVAKLGFDFNLEHSLTLLARHGAAAVPIYATAIASVTNRDARKRLAAGLAMIRTREALEAFVPLLGVGVLAGPLQRAFKGMPDEGKEILARVAASEDRGADAAAELLVQL